MDTGESQEPKSRRKRNRKISQYKQEKYDARFDHKALYEHFQKHCLVIKYENLDAYELPKAPSYTSWTDEAQQMMETWEQTDGSFVPWSTLHLDKHGQVIMAYFGHRIMV
ncbi:hypothetical protein FRC19_002633 [Serendipita sp. 401]|nr:hypothetical protein FRC19_002633 [Serendipita sp. 401]